MGILVILIAFLFPAVIIGLANFFLFKKIKPWFKEAIPGLKILIILGALTGSIFAYIFLFAFFDILLFRLLNAIY